MSDNDPGLWPTHRQAAAIRSRRAVEPRAARPLPGPDRAVEPGASTPSSRSTSMPARRAARAADAATAAGDALRPAARRAPHDQRRHRDRRHPLHRRRGGADRPRPGATTPRPWPRCKRAGSIVFGKTNLPRWSGDGQSYNELFGTTNNPWDLARTPGGSSGGAAAAVAAGLHQLRGRHRHRRLGPDAVDLLRGVGPQAQLRPDPHAAATSTRSAAAGSRPTSTCSGRWPARSTTWSSLLGVLAGPTPDRAPAWRVELPAPRHERLADFRVGVWLDDPACPVDDEVLAVLERAVRCRWRGPAPMSTARPAPPSTLPRRPSWGPS